MIDLEELQRLHRGKVLHYVRSILKSQQDAEDVVSETFRRAAERQSDLDERNRPDQWLYRVARNICFDRLRRKKIVLSLNEAMLLPCGKSPQPNVSLAQALADLPPTYREAIVRFDLDQDTSTTICAETGETNGEFKGRLYRGRAAMRDKLTGHHRTGGT